jgi:hypothetical protein
MGIYLCSAEGETLDFGGFFRENRLFIAAFALIYIIIFAVYFPPFWASIDEHGYVKNAVLFSQGKAGVAEPEYACRASAFNGEEYVSGRFIGRSLSLLPFIPFGLAGVMLSGLAIHLINFLIILLIFRKLNIRKHFSLLYLFLPTFVWASRTVYPGLLTLTCFLVAVYFYLSGKKSSWALSGFALALAVLVRYDAAVPLFAFLFGVLLSKRERLPYMIAPMVPVALLVFAINSFLYGGALTTGTGGIGRILAGFAELDTMVPDLLVYSALLLLYLPLLLASPLLEKRTGMRAPFIAVSVAYLIINSRFTDFFSFDISLSSVFISRLRYLVPLIGILLIPYCSFLDSQVNRSAVLKRHFRKIFLISVVLMVFGTAFISSIHHGFLSESRLGVMQDIYAGTESGSLIVGSSDDCMYFMRGLLPDRKYMSISPGSDLAGNPQNINPVDRLMQSEPSYLVMLDYSYLRDRDSPRAEHIRGERAPLADFYEANKQSFELVFEDTVKGLAVYRHTGGELVEG